MSEEKKILSPAIRIVEDPAMGKILILTEPWKFTAEDGVEYVVPEGFMSDGASVPRALWRVLSPQLDFVTLGPSIEHDYRYEEHIGTRAAADEFYRKRLIENGYPSFKAYLTWVGVRLGGGSHW